MITNVAEIRVRYAETDRMGVVYNGVYLAYFEVGRAEMLRAIGFPYKKLEEEGYLLPVRSAAIDYRAPAEYDDLLRVEARMEAMPTAKLRIDYRVVTGEKEAERLVATGHTEHAFVRAEDLKPARPPAFFLELVEEYYKK